MQQNTVYTTLWTIICTDLSFNAQYLGVTNKDIKYELSSSDIVLIDVHLCDLLSKLKKYIRGSCVIETLTFQTELVLHS